MEWSKLMNSMNLYIKLCVNMRRTWLNLFPTANLTTDLTLAECSIEWFYWSEADSAKLAVRNYTSSTQLYQKYAIIRKSVVEWVAV